MAFLTELKKVSRVPAQQNPTVSPTHICCGDCCADQLHTEPVLCAGRQQAFYVHSCTVMCRPSSSSWLLDPGVTWTSPGEAGPFPGKAQCRPNTERPPLITAGSPGNTRHAPPSPRPHILPTQDSFIAHGFPPKGRLSLSLPSLPPPQLQELFLNCPSNRRTQAGLPMMLQSPETGQMGQDCHRRKQPACPPRRDGFLVHGCKMPPPCPVSVFVSNLAMVGGFFGEDFSYIKFSS